MNKDQRLPKDAFYAQFHNSDNPSIHSVNHPTKEWWEMYQDVPEAETGKPMSYARGGAIHLHPALKIPGIHIRTAEAGEPIFHGDE